MENACARYRRGRQKHGHSRSPGLRRLKRQLRRAPPELTASLGALTRDEATAALDALTTPTLLTPVGAGDVPDGASPSLRHRQRRRRGARPSRCRS